MRVRGCGMRPGGHTRGSGVCNRILECIIGAVGSSKGRRGRVIGALGCIIRALGCIIEALGYIIKALGCIIGALVCITCAFASWNRRVG